MFKRGMESALSVVFLLAIPRLAQKTQKFLRKLHPIFFGYIILPLHIFIPLKEVVIAHVRS